MSKWLICVYVIYTYMLRGMWIIRKKTTKILQGAIWVQYRVDITVFCLRLACYVEIQVPWVSVGVSLLQRMKSVCLAGLQMDWKWFWGDQYRLAVAVARRRGVVFLRVLRTRAVIYLQGLAAALPHSILAFVILAPRCYVCLALGYLCRCRKKPRYVNMTWNMKLNSARHSWVW